MKLAFIHPDFINIFKELTSIVNKTKKLLPNITSAMEIILVQQNVQHYRQKYINELGALYNINILFKLKVL